MLLDFDSSFFVKLDAFLNVVTIRPLKLLKKKGLFNHNRSLPLS